MKTVASILFSLMFSISSIAQGTFFIKISGNRDLVCGDSLELESQIVNPVQLSIDMFMEGDDFINYQIEKKTSGDIIDSKFRTITSAYDTTYYLEHGLYIFKWLGGCAMCNNPVIEGQVGDWRVVDNYVECDFEVESKVHPDSVSFHWYPLESDSNRIKIAPTESVQYKVIAEHDNGTIASDSVMVKVLPLSVSSEDLTLTCGDTAYLGVSTNIETQGNLTYQWTPAKYINNPEIENPIAIISKPTDFKVIVTAYSGCIDSTQQSVIFKSTDFKPEICMVSVDSLNRNMVIWTPITDRLYESMLIYKETSQADVYETIGNLSVYETPVFTDTNSNPMQNSSRYKISLLDTCGNETSLSEYHKTIHLTINKGIGDAWNLLWDKYEGFEFSTYHIYRGSSGGGLSKIAEQPSNTFTYTDLTPPPGTSFYQIEVINPAPCYINIKSNEDGYNSTRSNIVNSDQISNSNEIFLDGMMVFPNPATDKINIGSTIHLKSIDLQIISLEGKCLLEKSEIMNDTEIDISILKDGIYILKLSSDQYCFTQKFIKR